MKKTIIILFMLFIYQSATAGEITRGVEPKEKMEVSLINVPSPTDVSNAQHSANQSINYILKTYSDKKLRNYVLSINRLERKEALKAGRNAPAELNESVLSSREKMGEYLKNKYKFTY